MELNALIQVRQDALLLESVAKAVCKVAEGPGSTRMARRTLMQDLSAIALHILHHTVNCRAHELLMSAKLNVVRSLTHRTHKYVQNEQQFEH